MDAFKGLAEFGGFADDSEELDLHRDEVSVLAESVGLLSEASWLKHDVSCWSVFVKLKSNLGVAVKFEECNWLVGTKRSLISQSLFPPCGVVTE